MKGLNLDFKSLKIYIIVLFSVMIFGNAMHDIILFFTRAEEDSTVFPLATVLMIGVIFGYMIYYGGIADAGRFNLMISMGCTRREYFSIRIAELALEVLVGYVASFCCNTFEKWKFIRFYKEIPVELDISVFFSLKYAVPVFLFLAAVSFTASICIMKYGVKAFWGLYIVFMVCCLGVPRIIERLSQNTTVIKFFVELGSFEHVLIAGAILVSFILFLVDRRLLFKQEVSC